MSETLRDRLIREERLELFPYPDSEGIWTIGVGHNIEADPDMFPNLEHLKETGITKVQALDLLDKDIQTATDELLEYLPWTGELDDWPRKSVLIDMAFNLGIEKLLGFHLTLLAVQDGRYEDAAKWMLGSKWADEVGNRAKNLARIMRTGEM